MFMKFAVIIKKCKKKQPNKLRTFKPIQCTCCVQGMGVLDLSMVLWITGSPSRLRTITNTTPLLEIVEPVNQKKYT